MKFRPIKVEIPRKVLESFKTAAKKAFPRETLAYIIGQAAGDVAVIERFWFPEDARVTCDSVWVEPHWIHEATEFAREHEAMVLGDIHSHPYSASEKPKRGRWPQTHPSEADLDLSHGQYLSGICRVIETTAGLRANVRIWGPAIPVIVRSV